MQSPAMPVFTSIAAATPSAQYAVAARKVSYDFGSGQARKQVVSEIDLDMRSGEFVILTGPSGAGKTTLLTLIGALRSLQSGKLAVLGTELLGLSQAGQRDIRRRIGFIFQDHNLFDALTVFQTLSLASVAVGRALAAPVMRDKAQALLARLGMEEYLNAKPNQLSVGQQQRVAIARALINEPSIVLADEPTASLDADNAVLVIDLLKERAWSGCTIVMVTHDQRVFSAADRVLTMVDGRIVRG